MTEYTYNIDVISIDDGEYTDGIIVGQKYTNPVSKGDKIFYNGQYHEVLAVYHKHLATSSLTIEANIFKYPEEM